MPGSFLDTSGLYETVDRRAARHETARTEFERLLRERRRLVTTDLVVSELHGLALGRAGPEVALAVVEKILDSGRVEIVATGPGRLRDAVELLRARPGRRLSLADAVSFLVMREHAITEAFALDADFAAEGFTTLPVL